MFHRVDRTEFKFLIPLGMRDEVVEEVEKHTGFDKEAGGSSQYPIISQYYDNALRDCYWEKQRGQKSRRKLRIRVYGSNCGKMPPTTFIEVKHKHYGRGVKRRLRLPMEDALELAEGETSKMLVDGGRLSRYERMVVDEIVGLVKSRDFQFLCTMRYDRQAFVGGDDAPDLRVTFDTGIACRFEQLDLQANDQRFEHYLIPDDQCIMEVKTNTVIPYWLRNLIGSKKLVRRSYSKFCTALEKHDPVVREALYGPNSVPFPRPGDVAVAQRSQVTKDKSKARR
ncbi:MAG: polyphosphate polymerase domain-containing protein [Akkermansiaceae bacterium]|nr:polyphosphate polymerase domain-containing protein [Akkermansiaceae bacterium]